jgi:hypothetical protein
VVILPDTDDEGARTVIQRVEERLADDPDKPQLAVGAGVAELTSHRSVEYWDSQQNFEEEAEAGKLDAWRRTGKVFFAPGVGVVIPAGSRGGVTVDLRGMFLFGKSATAIALAVGYAFGI